ncbi:MAG TPA: hypothetical protein PK098_08450 [Phycisphaerales bacterium]|nr:hypothetical protein [Phycisphaerales bacterium]
MKKSIVCAAAVGALCTPLWANPSGVLHDNGTLVTEVGGHASGADLSRLLPPHTTLGTNWNSPGFRMADSFTVTDAQGWTLSSITVYGYVTGWTNLALSPFGGATLEIWDGDPRLPTSQVIFGDGTTNRMYATQFANMYRIGSATPNTDTARAVFELKLGTSIPLQPGTYWISVSSSLGNGATGTRWMPGRTETFNTGVSLQRNDAGAWTEVPTDLAFIVEGKIGAGAPCPADLNNSGAVDVQDLLILLGAWGTNPGHPADLNNSGAVDVQDLLILLGAWGACPPAPAAGGACCFNTGACQQVDSATACAKLGGTYWGDYTSCDTTACPPPPSGAVCANAVTVSLNTPTTLSTVGNPVAGFSPCGNAPAPGSGTAWYTITGNGTQFTAATCGSGLGSVRVTVFCNACDALTCIAGEFEDPDSNCENSFQAAATWCAANGTTYYIAVYGAGTNEGSVTLTVTSDATPCTSNVDCGQVFPPVCTLPTAQCQVRSGGSYVTSDTNLAFKATDDFRAAVSGNITSLCWQGVELQSGPFAVCLNNLGQGQQFRITYRNDAGGIPGTVKAGPFTVQPTFARIGFIGFAFGNAGLIDYTATHPSVPVTAGECVWVEIVQINAAAACAFLWAPSADGNGVAYQTAEANPSYVAGDKLNTASGNNDRTFCIGIQTEDPDACIPTEAACCVNGNCSILSQTECAKLGGCYYFGLTCAQVQCVQEDYAFDCGSTSTAIGWTDGGVFVWLHRFDVDGGGSDTLTQVLTTFGNFGSTAIGVTAGQDFGVAIYADNAGAPGTMLFNTVAQAAAGSIGTDVLQAVNVPNVAVNGSFFVAVWVQHAGGTFPSPLDGPASPGVGRAFFGGTVGGTFGTFDPSNPAAWGIVPTDLTTTTLPHGSWLLRANGN